MGEQVRAVRHHIDYETRIADRHGVEKGGARCGIDVQLEDALVLVSEAELARRAEHPIRGLAPNPSPLDLHPVRHHRPARRERIQRVGLHVRRAANDVEQSAGAGIDLRHPEVIRVRVRTRLDDPTDHDRGEVRAERVELVDGRYTRGDQVAQPGRCLIERHERPEPLVRDVHSATCSRKRTSESYRMRMSGMPYRLIAIRAGPMPNAQPVYRSLSTPAASSTAGCTIPLPRISTHPVCLQTPQPDPPQTPHCTSISAEGSVNGKKLGRKRVGRRPKKRFANRVRVAFRSTKLMPSSTQSPSICSNAGACDGSKKSRR